MALLSVGSPFARGLVAQLNPLGDLSASVAADVYGGTGACGQQYKSLPNWGYQSVWVCAGENLEVSTQGANLPEVEAGDNVVFYSVTCYGGQIWVCTFGYGSGQLPPDGVVIDPLLRTAIVKGTIDTCAIDVTLASEATPVQTSRVFQTAEPDAGLSARVIADLSLSRNPATLQGSLCGMTLPLPNPNWSGGSIWRSLDASVDVAVRTT